MKQLRRFLVAVVLMAGATFAFSSCDKDEENGGGNDDNGGGNAVVAIHEHVDLGLPSGTKWATCNVGATSPESYGDYFVWGETKTKKTYTEDNSKWIGVEYSDLKAQGVIDADGNLTPKYDAATANWGEDWRMPTFDEIKELLTLENEYVEVNGVYGRKFIGTNGNTLFLPFAGDHIEEDVINAEEYGIYLSATACENVWDAHGLDMNSTETYWNYRSRNWGYTVRPVVRTK